jgi:hypothetical protein
VTPSVTPVHTAMAPVSITPSCRKYKARNGITSVKPMKPTKAAETTASWLRRQDSTTRAG